MFFDRKIFIHNKPLILTNSTAQYLERHPEAKGYLSLEGASGSHFRTAQQHLKELPARGVVIGDVSVEALLKELDALYEPIEAAGGVVTNPEGGVLLIYRRGKWDLPKGKRDEGESIEDCAEREVIEETGLPALTMGDKICETYHVYMQDGTELLKTTYWYQMEVPKAFDLVPQKEEQILEARWVAEKKIGNYMSQSYDAIREVLLEAGKKW